MSLQNRLIIDQDPKLWELVGCMQRGDDCGVITDSSCYTRSLLSTMLSVISDPLCTSADDACIAFRDEHDEDGVLDIPAEMLWEFVVSVRRSHPDVMIIQPDMLLTLDHPGLYGILYF